MFGYALLWEDLRCGNARVDTEDALDLLDSLLLLHVGLAQSLEDSLLLPLKTFRFTVLLADLNDLLFDYLVFLLSDLGPLLSGHLVNFLFRSVFLRL